MGARQIEQQQEIHQARRKRNHISEWRLQIDFQGLQEDKPIPMRELWG